MTACAAQAQQWQAHIQTVHDLLRAPPWQSLENERSVAEEFVALDTLHAAITQSVQELNARQSTELQARVDASRRTVMHQLVGAIVLALVLALWLGIGLARPFKRLERAIRRLGENQLEQPVAITGPADLRRVGQQLEWLRLRLLELDADKARFLRHVSHELKTPLAALREGVALLQDGVTGALSEGQKEVTQILHQNTLALQTQADVAYARSLQVTQLQYEAGLVARADVIIEAIFENLEVKRSLFAELEARAKPDAVLATNTSSLRLEDIATALKDPSRLVGIHFFNPVPMLPLVEVVQGEATDAEVLRRATGFVRRIDKLPLPVKSAPGFLVNAVLGPYMLEALRCVEEGIAPATVDAALVEFGMPMGPVELVDTVGLDIAMAAGKALAGEGAEPPKRLMKLVGEGKLGRKTGEGYYRWVDGKAVKGEGEDVAKDGLLGGLVRRLRGKRASDAPLPIPAGLAERVLAPMKRISGAWTVGMVEKSGQMWWLKMWVFKASMVPARACTCTAPAPLATRREATASSMSGSAAT